MKKESQHTDQAPTTRKINLQDAMKAVDEWLNSDDTRCADKDGDPIPDATIQCAKGSLLHRFIEKMTKN